MGDELNFIWNSLANRCLWDVHTRKHKCKREDEEEEKRFYQVIWSPLLFQAHFVVDNIILKPLFFALLLFFSIQPTCLEFGLAMNRQQQNDCRPTGKTYLFLLAFGLCSSTILAQALTDKPPRSAHFTEGNPRQANSPPPTMAKSVHKTPTIEPSSTQSASECNSLQTVPCHDLQAVPPLILQSKLVLRIFDSIFNENDFRLQL